MEIDIVAKNLLTDRTCETCVNIKLINPNLYGCNLLFKDEPTFLPDIDTCEYHSTEEWRLNLMPILDEQRRKHTQN